MKWLRVSLLFQAMLALYFQLIQWLPLGSWNYQSGFSPLGVEAMQGRAAASDILLVTAFMTPFVVFWFAYSRNLRWLMWSAALGYAIWLALQVKTWWVAYAFGASDSWMAVYRRVFSHSTQLLPSFGRHLPPDGMHLLLHVLLMAIVVSAGVGLLKTSGRPDSA
jgi:hypothetical protein